MMNYTTEPLATLSLFPAIGSAYDQAESLYDEDDDAHSTTSSASSSLSEPHFSPDTFCRQRQASLAFGMHPHGEIHPPTPDISRQIQLSSTFFDENIHRSVDRARMSRDVDVRHLPESPPELRRSEGSYLLSLADAGGAQSYGKPTKRQFTDSQFGEPIELGETQQTPAQSKCDC